MTKPKHSGAFSGHCFPPEIIGYAVWVYHRFPMSLRDAEDLFATRGVVVSDETIRAWVAKSGSQYARVNRRDRPNVADKWPLGEVVLPIKPVRSIGCGALLIAKAMYWTSSSSLGVTNKPQLGFFASSSRHLASHELLSRTNSKTTGPP